MIRVALPQHVRTLAGLPASELEIEVPPPVTQRAILNAIEERYPMVRGLLRDHATQVRRPFIRFFACEQDWSHESPDAELPAEVAAGQEPFLVVGAIAGGKR